MLNIHPINRLSKAGAALVNTISSFNVNVARILVCFSHDLAMRVMLDM